MAVEEQLELNLGGLPDNTIGQDPVSGNDIPLGSTAENVRDDIPANLSEGEIVVPADVVNFHGVKLFEDLRAEAKIGYAQMAEDGRIGGSPLPTTTPNMAIGGRINRRRKTRKTRKKIHRNRSNKSIGVKSQKGGVLFKIQDSDLEKLNHIGLRGTVGEGDSCVACSMHQLRFPIELVDQATRLANRKNLKGNATGVYFFEIKQLINN